MKTPAFCRSIYVFVIGALLMKKLIFLLSLFLIAVALIAPAAVRAASTITVSAPKADQPISENDVLTYVSDTYSDGYINETFYMSQSTPEERMDYLKQWATKGFDPNTTDPFMYSIMLPNSATVETATTWFGHPIVQVDGQYEIKGWFSDGEDAVLDFSIVGDSRLPDFQNSLTSGGY